MHYLTPETATTLHYYWSITNNFNVEIEEYYAGTKAFASIGFAEDKWASEHMQKLLDDDQIDYKEMIIAGDKAECCFVRSCSTGCLRSTSANRPFCQHQIFEIFA